MSSSDGANEGRWAAAYAAAISSATRSGRAKTDTFIQAAHPIPLQVDRDVRVAERAQLADDPLAHIRIERARHLVDAELEARKCLPRRSLRRRRVVMPDAAHTETELA